MPSKLQFSALSILLIGTFVLPAKTFAEYSSLISYPNFEKEVLEPANVGAKYSDSNRENLILLLDKTAAERLKEKSKNEDELKLLAFASRLLMQDHKTEKDSEESYMAAEQILYSVLTNDYTDTTTTFEIILKSPRFVKKYFTHANTSIPFMYSTKDKNHYFKSLEDIPKIKAASKEAQNLVRQSSDTSFVSTQELSKMTYKEISELDISDNHPIWKSRALKASTKDAWAHQEQYMERAINASLGTKNDYQLSSARKVVFFSKVKDNATAPKINARDAFGIQWKLKWGGEVPIENINNRLYLAAGAKYANLTYTSKPGKEGTTLILQNEGLRTPEDFLKLMKESAYNVDLSREVYTSGQITKENINDVLSNYPVSNKTKLKKESLIGRYYITFRELSMTLKSDDGITRGGGTNMNSGMILDDRVSRAQLVYDMWIWNYDAKEDNNASVLLENNSTDSTYVEYRHDMGSALGKRMFKGEVNNLGVGSDFLSHSIGNYGRNIVFHQPVYFKPKAWDKTTYADARWMAKQILDIPKEEIIKAIEASHMPDFYQKVLLQKLLSRRATLASFFYLSVPESDKNLALPQVNISLATHAEREAAAKKYGISVQSIEKELSGLGFLAADGIARDPKGKPLVDSMIYVDIDNQWVGYKNTSDGRIERVFKKISNVKIQKCEKTVLLGLLTRERYVSGITTSIASGWDQVPVADCGYGRKYKPATGKESFMRFLSEHNLF